MCLSGTLIYFNMKKNKNIILVVGGPTLAAAQNILDFQDSYDEKLRFFIINNKKATTEKGIETYSMFEEVLMVNFDSDKSISKAIAPYREEFLAVTCRADSNIPKFQKLIPHLPYLKTPLPVSLGWSVDKIEMRRRFKAYDSKITPKYMYVKDSQKETIKRIEEKVGFPLIVKPSGFAASLLVSMAYHHEELEKTLRKVFRKMKVLSKRFTDKEPRVLVEQFMEGTMYSVDAYVNSRGVVYFCPMVSVKTGKEAGFDDFFGYQQMTPVKLKKSSIEDAQEVAEKAVHALGLRSTTVHVELMRTENGWKIIEVGPRIGGFRHVMYELSYGIDHTANDILIRIPQKPLIPKKILGHTAVFKIFPKNPGTGTWKFKTRRRRRES